MSACDCERCRRLCRRNPGWFAPADARAALDAGHARSLMRDWLEPSQELGNESRIYLLAPAVRGHEGGDAPELDLFDILCGGFKGACTFHRDGLCGLHDSGFKPLQCRTAFGCKDSPEYPDNFEVARMWDTEEGRAIVARWHQLIGETHDRVRAGNDHSQDDG